MTLQIIIIYSQLKYNTSRENGGVYMEEDQFVDYVMAGKRVRKARLRNGMSQEGLANAANLSVPYLSHIENARSKASLATFIRLANALDLTLNDLFCDSLQASITPFRNQIEQAISNCTDAEIRFVASSIESLISALREHDNRLHRKK